MARWHGLQLSSRTARRGIAAFAIIGLTVLVVGCGGPAVSGSASPAAPSGTSSQPPAASRTFPPSQTAIEPGTYRWAGFKPPISVTVDAGWQIGHDNPAFFDLFRGSDFPSISFAQFTEVYVNATGRAAATNRESVTSALSARSDLTLTAASTVDLGGLRGSQFDVVTTQPKTPLFFGPAGDFRLDPEFKTRYRVLDVAGGGVIVIGIHTRVGQFDDGLVLGEPVVASLNVGP